MADTYSTWCSDCDCEMDMIIGTGEKPVCDECKEEADREALLAEEAKNDSLREDVIDGSLLN